MEISSMSWLYFWGIGQFIYEEVERAKVILFHGGSGSLGSLFVQIARLLDFIVICTAGTEEKVEFVRGLGADLVVNYTQSDLFNEVLAFTEWVDIIVDMIGYDYFENHLSILKPHGTLVHISSMAVKRPTLDISLLISKRLTLKGVSMRSSSLEIKNSLRKFIEYAIWPHLVSGAIKTYVDSVYPLVSVNEAYKVIEKHTNMGKVLLKL